MPQLVYGTPSHFSPRKRAAWHSCAHPLFVLSQELGPAALALAALQAVSG